MTKIILVEMAVVLLSMGGYALTSYMQTSKQLNQSLQTRSIISRPTSMSTDDESMFHRGIARLGGSRCSICLSFALGQEKMLLDSIACGVRDFVVKPFTQERLLSAVQKALS